VLRTRSRSNRRGSAFTLTLDWWSALAQWRLMTRARGKNATRPVYRLPRISSVIDREHPHLDRSTVRGYVRGYVRALSAITSQRLGDEAILGDRRGVAMGAYADLGELMALIGQIGKMSGRDNDRRQCGQLSNCDSGLFPRFPRYTQREYAKALFVSFNKSGSFVNCTRY
jgi:hypothetical protein